MDDTKLNIIVAGFGGLSEPGDPVIPRLQIHPSSAFKLELYLTDVSQRISFWQVAQLFYGWGHVL